jgi:DNA-directed RNA polymerase II subunit RPB1
MPAIKKFDSVRMMYTLHLTKINSKKFADQFTLSIQTKQEILDYHMQLNYTVRNSTKQYKSLNDVIFDTIVSIKEVRPIKGWVYDLTVESTRNFTGLDCVVKKDTFHLAGVAAKSNVTRGVPRLKELLKVTKNPKATTLTVYLKPEFRESREKAREVSQDLELTLLRDITVKAATYYDPKLTSTVLEEDKELLTFYTLFEERMQEAAGITEESEEEAPEKWSRWMLRLEFDREKMFNKNISIDDIAFVLNTNFGEDVNMVYSDYNSQKLIMRIRLSQQIGQKGESTLDDLLLLKKFQNKILNGIVIRGVAGIKSAPFRFLSQELEQFKVLKDGKYETIQEYVLDTDGSNFLDVVNHPLIDGSRVVSSHVHDILPYLGIEAARATLISEMTSLFNEIGINYRHVGLLTDVMTRGGRLMSIDRYGINKMDIGPLAKASFEETEKILLRAAIFGEMDPVTGVSSNIMTGQAIRGGTAFSQILLDEALFIKLQETIEDIGREEDDIPEIGDEVIYNEIFQDPNDRCSTTRLRMNMVLPNADIKIEEEDIEINILD